MDIEEEAVELGFGEGIGAFEFDGVLRGEDVEGLGQGAGLAAGWGIQFQQPLFLAAMALLLTLFACNLFGFFELRMPAALANLAGRDQGHGLIGHFGTGAFATLLATPCSAPFLGTAIGFALARGPGEILLIFTALGLGLALPYLAVAALPGLAARLPRPAHSCPAVAAQDQHRRTPRTGRPAAVRQ